MSQVWSYTGLGDRGGNLRHAQAAGFEVPATHVLSGEGWTPAAAR